MSPQSGSLRRHGARKRGDLQAAPIGRQAPKRKEIVAFLRASRKGWDENFKDPAVYPPMFADTWFKGTGRSIENEVYFNTAQKPLMEAKGGIFSMSEESIAKNIEALAAVGISATRDMFDTTVLEEI